MEPPKIQAEDNPKVGELWMYTCVPNFHLGANMVSLTQNSIVMIVSAPENGFYRKPKWSRSLKEWVRGVARIHEPLMIVSGDGRVADLCGISFSDWSMWFKRVLKK